jgi:hypothetical protein
MSLADSLRKGLKFFLMSLGISSPARASPNKKPAPQPGPEK